ncbi:MAG: Flp pilus assembly protein CpaB [Planctomycetes bacterium]|nr:Flp pilus assembly protein CpaB [Planctomycetota bacterium]
MTNKLALAVAIALGVLSILGIRSYVAALEKKVQITGNKAPYLILTDDFKKGHKLTSDDVTRKEFQIEAITDALKGTEVTESKLSAYLGRPLRVSVKAGQILTTTYFDTKAGRVGSPSKVLEDNERLVTIPVTAVSSVSGLIRPGDFVDMVATMAVPDRGGQALGVTFTVFRGKPVVATGSDINRDAIGTRGAYSNITLRVTTKEANQIIYCLHNNIRYQFTLLRAGSISQTSTDPVVEAQMIKDPLRDLRR